MSKRRGRGEGNIYFIERRNLWSGRISLGNGERKAVYAKSKGELIEKMTRVRADVISGNSIITDRSTVAEYLERWLEGSVKPSVRPSTTALYKSLVNVHLSKHLGPLRLQKLTPAHVQTMLSEAEAAGTGARTRQKALLVLHKACAQAVRWRILPYNPCDAVNRPRWERKPPHALTEAQSMALLLAAKRDRHYALIALALATGMRQGELFALKWEDVDRKNGVVNVTKNLVELSGKLTLAEPKTQKGRRKIELPAFASKALKEHRKAMFAEGHAHDFVFCDKRGGPLRKSNFIRRHFAPIVEAAKLPPMRFHDLRHTCASLLMARGVHVKVVQERLGHATVGVTLDTYSHTAPGMQKAAADALESAFAIRKA